EGSTDLLRDLGDRYARLLRDVRTLIRKSVRDNAGHEVDARADEFFAAFKRPAHALAAAMGIHRGLRARQWPGGQEVCVRIGIHSGRTTFSESGYVGIAVHLTSRLCSAGHGGQTLLSAAAHDALDLARAEGFAVRLLGRYAPPASPEPETVHPALTAA